MNASAHNKIARHAQSLWRERGCPSECDDVIWLEAERQINENTPPTNVPRLNSFTERAKAETAAESVVEFQITPASSEQEAIRAALQVPDATFRAKR